MVKHALWALLLQRLGEKAKPLEVYETHAGRGLYRLDLPEMAKLKEYTHGLTKVWEARHQAPAQIVPLLEAIGAVNPRGEIAVYPGSPAVTLAMLRPDDKVHVCEAHPQEYTALEEAVGHDPRVTLYKTDGPRRVPHLLPPKEGRAAVLVDPSYDIKDEYLTMADTVKAMVKRFPKLVGMVWYPLLPDGRHEALEEGMAALGISSTYQTELQWREPGERGVYGTGQIFFNLPYQMESEVDAALAWLAPVLGGLDGRWEGTFITPPK